MTTRTRKPPLLSSIRDPHARAAVLAEHVGEAVALTIRLGNDTTFTGRLIAVVPVYGRDSWVALVTYETERGTRRTQAFPHGIWRQVEAIKDATPAGEES